MNHAETVQLFNDLYRDYEIRLRRQLAKTTFDFEEREDILQETFTRVWQQLQKDGYNENLSAPFTWIFMISQGASQRLIEQKNRQIPPFSDDVYDLTEHEPPEEVDDVDDPGFFTMELDSLEDGMVDYNTPEMVLMREQEEDELDATVDELSEDYREILAMHYYDGKTYVEISTELSIPVETVRTRLRRARERLKALLGEEES